MDKKDIEEVLSLENDSNDGGEDINIKGNDEEDFTQSYVESLTKNSLEKRIWRRRRRRRRYRNFGAK